MLAFSSYELTLNVFKSITRHSRAVPTLAILLLGVRVGVITCRKRCSTKWQACGRTESSAFAAPSFSWRRRTCPRASTASAASTARSISSATLSSAASSRAATGRAGGWSESTAGSLLFSSLHFFDTYHTFISRVTVNCLLI